MSETRPIPNSPGWSIAENGDIFNASGKLMKPHIASHYLRIQVPRGTGDGIRKSRSVHRLVWESWKGQIPQGYWINHKDGNKLNNNLENLECETPKHNHEHARDVLKRKWATGESAGAKIHGEAKEAVLCLHQLGWSTHKIAKVMLVTQPAIIRLLKKQNRKVFSSTSIEVK